MKGFNEDVSKNVTVTVPYLEYQAMLKKLSEPVVVTREITITEESYEKFKPLYRLEYFLEASEKDEKIRTLEKDLKTLRSRWWYKVFG